MANVAPSVLFSGYEFLEATDPATADSIAIPIASLPALADTEAHATTGVGMEVVRAITNKAFTAIEALPPAERPTKSSIVKQPPKLLANGNYEITYITKFELAFDDNAAVPASE